MGGAVLEEGIGGAEALRLVSARDPAPLLAAARRARAAKGGAVTFSKKAFINVTTLCRDACGYCTYRAEPGAAGASLMGPEAVRGALRAARRAGCVEALLVAGERPEERYPEARDWLRAAGARSTPEYLARCSDEALEEGLFPHTNAGNLDAAEVRALRRSNPSIGIMLESASGRLAGRGGPHEGAPSKDPARRMETIRLAGEAGLPVTTGILVGIGETDAEAVGSLLAIREAHARHGHVQEVILQNFLPKPGTAMARSPAAARGRLMRLVAAARLLMPRANIQVPPNLSPGSYAAFLGAGVNDWGGVSPLTPDYVNPEMPWPSIRELEERTAAAGYELRCRFPVYPEFARMASARARRAMGEVAARDGTVDERRWR